MKVRRIITAVTMAMAIVCLSFGSVSSVEAAEYMNSQINDIDFTLDQLADGVTIVLTSRTLNDNVDTGDNTKVRVGFTNVVLKTVAGEYGYFSNTSQVVSR